MRTQLVTGEDVWPRLKDLASATAGPRLVATAYLGDRAGDQLGLREGDVLVVALCKRNAKNGSVSPKEIKRLMRRGVEVFVDEYLHAKVYLFDHVLAVGSPNLSRNSEGTLHESLLVTSQAGALREARVWFDELKAAPVSPDWLDQCLSVYKPPKWPTASRTRASVQGRVWLAGIREMDFPEDEAQVRAAGEEEAIAEVRCNYDIEILRFTGKSLFAREVKSGDLVITVWKEERSRRVYPHARVVGRRRTKSRRGAQVLYVYVEVPTDAQPSSWTKFRAGMKAVGLRLGAGVSTRELKGQRITARAKVLSRHG